MKKTRIYFTIISLISICFVLVGCGGGSVGNNNTQANNLIYIGPWKGIINGSGGQDTFRMSVSQDGTLTVSGSTAYYTFTIGTWNASGSNFKATVQRDSLVVNINANIFADSISGTWSGNNGTSGTFSVSRPPEAGTWIGSINGSGGFANLTMILNKNGTISTQTNSSFYFPLSGSWNVINTQFNATASGEGVLVNFSAAIQGNSMAGTWSGNNRTAGTFATIKK